MTTDSDLDVMNIIRDLPETDAAFYFRADGDDGFYYYKGTVEQMSDALIGLMGQDENVKAVIVHTVKNFTDGA